MTTSLPVDRAALAARAAPSGERVTIRISDEGYVTDPSIPRNGLDDAAPKLAAALARLQPGQRLYLGPGEFLCGSSGWRGLTLENRPNVTILGDGAVLRWGAVPEQTAPFSGNRVGLIARNSPGVRLVDMKVNGNGAEMSGVLVHDSDGYRIDDCEAWGHAGGGWQFGAGRNKRGKVRRSTARDSTEIAGNGCRGFWLGFPSPTWGEDDVEITASDALRNGGTGIVLQGLRCRAVSNESSDNLGAGIASSTSAGNQSADHLAAFNTLRNNKFWAWQTDVWNGVGCLRPRLIANVMDLTRTDSAGLLYLNAQLGGAFIGNVMTLAGGQFAQAIRVASFSGPTRGVQLTGNEIHVLDGDQAVAISIQPDGGPGEGNEISDLVLTANPIVVTAPTGRGIRVLAPYAGNRLRRLQLIGNPIVGGQYGLEVYAAAVGALIEDVTLTGNNVSGSTANTYRFLAAAAGGVSRLRLQANVDANWGGAGAQTRANVTPAFEAGNSWN
jgi:hypothetical protein